MGVFLFLGIICLIASAALFFIPKIDSDLPQVGRFAKYPLVLGLVFLVAWKLFFYAQPGHFYVVQYVSGTQKVITGSGPKFRWFGQVIDFNQVLTLKFSKKSEGDYSGYDKPYQVRFNDAVVADVSTSIRIRLPSDHERLKKLAIEYRSQDNLVSASLMPTIREVLRNSARMISAQDYIVGKGGIFEQAVIDQLQNGICELEIRTYRDTTNQPIQSEEQRFVDNGNMTRTEVVKIRNSKGEEVRKKHAFLEYGIEVTQSVIDNVDPEEKFKDLLAQQRDAAGKSNIARQEAQKAEFEKQKIIAQGEAEKASVRVTQEKEQVEILIKSETEMKKQKTEVEIQKYALAAQELAAKSLKIKADAEAYQKRAVMQADGALEKKLDAIVQINKAYAEAIKGSQLVPTTLISSDGKGSSASDLIQLLTAQTASQVSKVAQEK